MIMHKQDLLFLLMCSQIGQNKITERKRERDWHMQGIRYQVFGAVINAKPKQVLLIFFAWFS
jgi:hypothetical protein